MRTAILTLLCLTALTACVGDNPSRDAQRDADYGPVPTNYKQQIEAWAETRFKPPLEVTGMLISPPQRAWRKVFGMSFVYGYRSYVTVEGRDKSSGNAGRKTFEVWYDMKDGPYVVD